ncbi:MAG: hypothetical protein A3J52_03310 [Omnitrophica bacterium RIFCSPHIGHO2_02_FULL_49_9]|nr:MAG: hypothetical protein A3J52_03310 [Omnitrophica bacterium RIFCSPHIGHO2_02_FULL_49_9]
MILEDILKHKKDEVRILKEKTPLQSVARQARSCSKQRRSLRKALSVPNRLHLICELKQASPSEGILKKNFEPRKIAEAYQSNGASAVSVLTESRYFKGSSKIPSQIRPAIRIPILRKDFIFDDYQIYETALIEADAFLLISSILTESEINHFIQLGKELELDALVEVHTQGDLRKALKSNADIIGINNRNLKTLDVDVRVAEGLIPMIPPGKTVVVESGIESRETIARYHGLGVNCFLIGSALMKAENIGQKMSELLSP